MDEEKQTRLSRLQNERIRAQKHTAEQRPLVFLYATRFGRRGEDADAESLASALKACDGLQRTLLSIERMIWEARAPDPRRVDVTSVASLLQSQRALWLTSMRDQLLRLAAEVHREAEIARRRAGAKVARRLFDMKNRFEFVAWALDDVLDDLDGE